MGFLASNLAKTTLSTDVGVDSLGEIVLLQSPSIDFTRPKPTPLCIVCKSDIKPDTLVCPTCKSYQDSIIFRCEYCRTIIPAEATICNGCKFYQKSWRNWHPYIGGLAAIIGLIGSACAFASSQLVSLYRI